MWSCLVEMYFFEKIEREGGGEKFSFSNNKHPSVIKPFSASPRSIFVQTRERRESTLDFLLRTEVRAPSGARLSARASAFFRIGYFLLFGVKWSFWCAPFFAGSVAAGKESKPFSPIARPLNRASRLVENCLPSLEGHSPGSVSVSFSPSARERRLVPGGGVFPLPLVLGLQRLAEHRWHLSPIKRIVTRPSSERLQLLSSSSSHLHQQPFSARSQISLIPKHLEQPGTSVGILSL